MTVWSGVDRNESTDDTVTHGASFGGKYDREKLVIRVNQNTVEAFQAHHVIKTVASSGAVARDQYAVGLEVWHKMGDSCLPLTEETIPSLTPKNGRHPAVSELIRLVSRERQSGGNCCKTGLRLLAKDRCTGPYARSDAARSR